MRKRLLFYVNLFFLGARVWLTFKLDVVSMRDLEQGRADRRFHDRVDTSFDVCYGYTAITHSRQAHWLLHYSNRYNLDLGNRLRNQ
jgi:hypothetical protein